VRNTFKKLRAEKKEVQNKLDIANKTICLQIDEIRDLNITLEEIVKSLKWHNSGLIKEVENKTRITKKLVASLGANLILIATIAILIIK